MSYTDFLYITGSERSASLHFIASQFQWRRENKTINQTNLVVTPNTAFASFYEKYKRYAVVTMLDKNAAIKEKITGEMFCIIDNEVYLLIQITQTDVYIWFYGAEGENLQSLIEGTSALTLFDDPEVTHGKVFALISQFGGLSTRELGFAGCPIEWDNYNLSVKVDVRKGIIDLQSKTPKGRLFLLEGEPGTGKTYLVRGILSEVKKAIFIVVPTGLVDKLNDPELLNFFIDLKNRQHTTGPIILILEDADTCLVKREADNMPYISSLLNITDGIIGDMLDIRIIATTNAKKTEFDPAILRKGRVSEHVTLGKLDATHAQRLMDKLCPNQSIGIGDSLLTDVYAEARCHGWQPTNPELK